MIQEITLSEIIGEDGVFVDGDWVESKDQDINGDVRLIQLADIGDGRFINKSNRFLTSQRAREMNCTFLEPGDLLIARMPDPIGRACVFPGLKTPCVTVVDVCIVRPDEKMASTEWLKFMINSVDFRNGINRFITGTTRQRISRGNLSKLRFKLPPLEDQIQIADILSKAEALITKREESILLLDKFLKSTFLEMFGTSSTQFVSLAEVCSKITDGTHDTPERLKEGVKFITGKHIRPFFIDFDNSDYVTGEVHEEIYRRCNPEFGDILYTNIGVNLGTAAMNTVRYQFSMKNVALLKPKRERINSRYLEHALNNERQKNTIINSSSSGGAQKFLSLGQINQIKIPLPPLKKQDYFQDIVEEADVLKARYQTSLMELESLHASLSQRAFKGELTLK
jgi:type I restriction enzyme S subunit